MVVGVSGFLLNSVSVTPKYFCAKSVCKTSHSFVQHPLKGGFAKGDFVAMIS